MAQEKLDNFFTPEIIIAVKGTVSYFICRYIGACAIFYEEFKDMKVARVDSNYTPLRSAKGLAPELINCWSVCMLPFVTVLCKVRGGCRALCLGELVTVDFEDGRVPNAS
ncbi:hypothetical protein ACJ72_04666 [Emergomyces africanus]|uniref:Uncharacterized protein n=1 Tax=Emergomyces africanus TaxID=1955775 RepID=A0A1B7NW52_9EURO|nr:hypothetical protein ACJ72_04666 [Emergomyces africanus]